jgi:hypothetical protein
VLRVRFEKLRFDVIHQKALQCLVYTIHRLWGQASLIMYYSKNASGVIWGHLISGEG